jgi:anti-sigma factor RsiW
VSDHALITCRELIDFIAAYLDGTLPVPSRREFDRHLAACSSCRAYLDGYRKTIAMGRLALQPTDQPASEVAPDWLVKAVRVARARQACEQDACSDQKPS